MPLAAEITHEKIFSYGTLQYESVQKSLFGRTLQGKPDQLPGFIIDTIKITDPRVLKISQQSVHKTLIQTHNPSDIISGMVFEITEKELLLCDRYEVDYRRISVLLESGIRAWIYVAK